MADKITDALVDALKQGLAEPGEQRLFRSGKLPGLFPSRAGANAEAATRAVRDGLIEVVRTEVKGKTAIEWARVSPRGIEFLHEHESPVRILAELKEVLQSNQQGVPIWLAQMQKEVADLGQRLTDGVKRLTERLETLTGRMEEALRRADAAPGSLANGQPPGTPWSVAALAYLDHRKAANAAGDCSLPELFTALREQHPDLTLAGFHDGLRRLADRNALRLLPFSGLPADIPEPEYALPDGGSLYFFVVR